MTELDRLKADNQKLIYCLEKYKHLPVLMPDDSGDFENPQTVYLAEQTLIQVLLDNELAPTP